MSLFILVLLISVIFLFFYFKVKIESIDSRLTRLEIGGPVGTAQSDALPEPPQPEDIAPTPSSESATVLKDAPPVVSGSSKSHSAAPKEPGSGGWSEEQTGRWVGIIGLVAVVIGVGLFLQYAFQNDWIGETGRVMLGIISGIGLLGLAQYLFKSYHGYAQIIMATGIILLYLSIFAAFGFYDLIAASTALLLILAISVLGAVVSVVNRALPLAFLSVTGGFIVPVFMSGGDVDPVPDVVLLYFLMVSALGLTVSYFHSEPSLAGAALIGGFVIPSILQIGGLTPSPFAALLFIFTVFGMGILAALSVVGGTMAGRLAAVSAIGAFLVPPLIGGDGLLDEPISVMTYVLVLLAATVALVLYRERWRALLVAAFLGTLLLAGPLFFVTDLSLHVLMAFGTAYFFLFAGAVVLSSLIGEKGMDTLTAVLSLAVTLFYMILGVSLLRLFDLSVFSGYFALWLAAFYFTVAAVVYRARPADTLLFLTQLGLGLVCLSVAIPLQLSGSWISLAWIVQALVLFYIAFQVPHRAMLHFGFVVLFVAGARVLFVDVPSYSIATFVPIVNVQFFLLASLTAALAWLSYLLAERKDLWSRLSITVAALGFLVVTTHIFALGALTFETVRFYEQRIYEVEREGAVQMREYQELGQIERVMELRGELRETRETLQYQGGMVISFLWGLYAFVLIVLGFVRNSKVTRILGVTLLLITAFKVFIDLWQLGELYRILSSITFGAMALLVSFLYAKYKKIVDEKLL